MKNNLFLFFLFYNFLSFSQTISDGKVDYNSPKIKWDTAYYKKYDSRLIVSLYNSGRQHQIEIEQFLFANQPESKVNYFAQSNKIQGIELNYDKINVSFGYKSLPTSDKTKTGDTKHFNLGLNVGGNRWLLETGYRSFKGFYDKNTEKYDTSVKKTGIYYQQPTLNSSSSKIRFLYFTNNKKFAFKSGYSCAYRQLKTSASWVIGGNFYFNKLNSDSTLLPFGQKKWYADYSDIKGINTVSFAAYAGASVNIIMFKALFLNLTFILGPETQWRTYRFAGPPFSKTLNYLASSGDARIAFGVNMKKFFITSTASYDLIQYRSGQMNFKSTYISVTGNIGYRFFVKTPKIYERFQQTKLYKLL